MAQLSLYPENEKMEALQKKAALANTSLSKYVVKFIVDNAAGGWPDGYRGLFGSIDDEALCEPKELILRVRWQSGGHGAGLIEQG